MCETESLSPCHCSAGNDSIIPTSSLTQEEPITRAQDCCLWSVCFISQITVVPVEEEWLLRLRNTLSESYRAPCGHVECVINKNLTHRPNKTRKESQEESETVTVTPNIQTAASLHTELTVTQTIIPYHQSYILYSPSDCSLVSTNTWEKYLRFQQLRASILCTRLYLCMNNLELLCSIWFTVLTCHVGYCEGTR